MFIVAEMRNSESEDILVEQEQASHSLSHPKSPERTLLPSRRSFGGATLAFPGGNVAE